MKAIPVKTRILTSEDNLIDVVIEYAKDKIGPNDVVTVAETVLAITQGRYKRPEDIKPSFLAKIYSYFFPKDGNLSSWVSTQYLIDEEGICKVTFALLIGSICKIFGKKGVFYQLAGEQARLIDDIASTMPPFDKYIVAGPKDPAKIAEAIRVATGAYGAAIVDVNDLKRVAVLGTSLGLDPDSFTEILLDNPFGNDSQKTPIVIIKDYTKS